MTSVNSGAYSKMHRAIVSKWGNMTRKCFQKIALVPDTPSGCLSSSQLSGSLHCEVHFDNYMTD